MGSSVSVWLKRVLLGLLLAMLLLPALQSRLQLIHTEELGGYAEKAPHPDFTSEGLLDNSYQPALEKYVEDRIGFRELLIRIRNQVAYSVFRVSKANKVLIGNDDILLDETAIRAYLGQDFKGENEIRRNVRRLKAVQDTLAKHNILLVFAITPDKANFYADQFPGYFLHQPRSTSNYTAYAREMQAKGVNLIDLAAVFQQWKDTASYPLFPRGGIHWSGYGLTLAADTLFRYIEQRGNLDLPDFRTTGRDVLDDTRDTDNDVAKAMNLLVPQKPFRMAYPRVEFEEPKPGQQKPDLLLVGDSFGWSLISFYPYLPKLFNEKFQYWYYNRAVGEGNPTEPGGPPVERELDRKAEMLKQRVILLLYTQHNLGAFDQGFSANAYDIFYPLTDADQTRIKAIEERLKQSTALQDSLWQQANAINRDYNELLREKALQQYELVRP
ncbi:alginate O-acetyltransferase AlgX-related protein [Hymenobacter sediminicola]|uniref:AlgX/AlgJ SGNH hydrolase-like domain-containing protein n=1 Tax=Hymenobacter sediminicola TaxID=2761579 RepID=A0A7G7W6V6_9BACT|nr:hypothetical protein [Hymenobacter sediminicola]QNH62099.1 hypothetical protein H4317_18445 [Hymenobacter sediminicola]